jgi:superfamily II DNA helicase RecQ
MIFKHESFSKLIRDPAWMQRVCCTVVDEAHCIVNWGANFRKDFDSLGTMRSFMTISRPFLIASATLTPTLLDESLDKLEINRNRMFKVNLGNDRPNITPIICTLPGADKDFSMLEFLVSEAHKSGALIRTIVYVNSRELSKNVCEHLWSKVPSDYRSHIDFIHSLRRPLTKKRVMRRFRQGAIKVLIATEVAGMVDCFTYTTTFALTILAQLQGMDIPDIRRVVQFKVPGSLSEWMQHFGRAGRDHEPAEAILLVEKSVFQTMTRVIKPPLAPKKSKAALRSKKSEVLIKRELTELSLQDAPALAVKRPFDVIDLEEHEGNQALVLLTR